MTTQTPRPTPHTEPPTPSSPSPTSPKEEASPKPRTQEEPNSKVSAAATPETTKEKTLAAAATPPPATPSLEEKPIVAAATPPPATPSLEEKPIVVAATPPPATPSLKKEGETAKEEEKEEPAINWQPVRGKNFASHYDKETYAKLAESYGSTLGSIQEGGVTEGTITHISTKHAVISIGYKSDGLLHRSELRDVSPPPAIGDKIDVFIERQEDKLGNLSISYKKAQLVRAWERVQKACDDEEVLEGKVTRRTKGGLIVSIFGLDAFLPGSQIDAKPVRDFDAYVDKTIEVKVVKISATNDNVVVSHKALIEKEIEQQRSEILSTLEKGQVLEGTVKNITNFGAFIDLGGIDGLLHITDIAWGRIGHAEDVLQSEQKVNVVVLGFDETKKRVSLGMKQLQPHPWEVTKDFKEGQRIKGKIVNVVDYGAFLEVTPGVEGLIHVSEMSWSQHLRNTQEFVKVGDEVEAIILSLDHETHKLSLGIKQLTQDPWQQPEIGSRYAPGTRHTGIVRNLTNYGVFLELEEGIDGLLHVSDLSWIKRIRNPSSFTKYEEKIEVVVMELDLENKRLSLSHKHLQPNPWEELADTFARGSTHTCSIMRRMEKVTILELPHGLEGICFTNNLVKEDQSFPEAGDSLPFVVTSFSKEEQRIVLSHVLTYRKNTEKRRREDGGGEIRSRAQQFSIDEVNKDATASTLGEIDALSSLKAKMDKADKDDKTEKTTKTDKDA